VQLGADGGIDRLHVRRDDAQRLVLGRGLGDGHDKWAVNQ
jgi:hypothetical protein